MYLDRTKPTLCYSCKSKGPRSCGKAFKSTLKTEKDDFCSFCSTSTPRDKASSNSTRLIASDVKPLNAFQDRAAAGTPCKTVAEDSATGRSTKNYRFTHLEEEEEEGKPEKMGNNLISTLVIPLSPRRSCLVRAAAEGDDSSCSDKICNQSCARSCTPTQQIQKLHRIDEPKRNYQVLPTALSRRVLDESALDCFHSNESSFSDVELHLCIPSEIESPRINDDPFPFSDMSCSRETSFSLCSEQSSNSLPTEEADARNLCSTIHIPFSVLPMEEDELLPEDPIAFTEVSASFSSPLDDQQRKAYTNPVSLNIFAHAACQDEISGVFKAASNPPTTILSCTLVNAEVIENTSSLFPGTKDDTVRREKNASHSDLEVRKSVHKGNFLLEEGNVSDLKSYSSSIAFLKLLLQYRDRENIPEEKLDSFHGDPSINLNSSLIQNKSISIPCFSESKVLNSPSKSLSQSKKHLLLLPYEASWNEGEKKIEDGSDCCLRPSVHRRSWFESLLHNYVRQRCDERRKQGDRLEKLDRAQECHESKIVFLNKRMVQGKNACISRRDRVYLLFRKALIERKINLATKATKESTKHHLFALTR